MKISHGPVAAMVPVQKAVGAPDVTVMAVVAAVGTFLGAFQLFQPKFAIGIAMRRETGRIEPGFFGFYILPQYITGLLVLLVWLTLLTAVLHQLDPTFVPASLWVQKALPYLALGNLIPLLLIAAVLAGVIQMNILSWLFLLLGRALSMLARGPISGAYGAKGRSTGWMQAWCVCATWDKGQPLLVSQEEVERVADELLLKLSQSTYTGPNFAPKPANASIEAAANIALFGCIIEKAHSTNHWKPPAAWTDFYVALAEIHDDSKMFEPQKLVKFKSGQAFSQKLRDELAAKMAAKSHSVPDGNYYGAASYISKAWSLVSVKKGSILNNVPFYSGVIGTKLYWFDRGLAAFPLLHAEGMRQQAIKLMTRWDVTPWVKEEDFLHPFSKTQAWLLLQEGVLTPFPEQKDVTFWASGDVGISKIACRRIFEHILKTVDEKHSAEVANVAMRFPEQWDLFAAADYTLWNWAHEQMKQAETAEWKGCHWKLDSGRVSKVT